MNWTFVKWLLGILLGGGLACTIVIVNKGCNDSSVHQNPSASTAGSPSPSPPQEDGPDLFSPNPVPNAPPPEWRQTDIKAQDKNGNGFGVRIGVLWDPYRWVFGSSSEIGIDDKESFPIEQIVQKSPKGESRPIIVVGAASHENAADNPNMEMERAGARADRLDALSQDHYPDADIYSLNLGFYRAGHPSSASSATERRVILLVVTCSDKGVDFDSGVRNALIKASKNDDFSFDVRNYSNFNEAQFHVRVRRTVGKTAIPECRTLAHNTGLKRMPDGPA